MKKFYRYLKLGVLSVILLLAGIFTISHTNYFDYEKPITFDRYDQISFENFRGIELFRKSLYGNKRFAYVVTSIDYEIVEDGVFVHSLFHPSRSFVYKRKAFVEELLTHEKYHFKITELYARKARKEISALRKIDRAEVKRIIRKTERAENSFQRLYDQDTFHSYVYGEQKKYERKIDSLLVLLSDFKNPKVEINEDD